MHQEHAQLIRQLIPLWYAQRAWACELIAHAFSLPHAQEILRIDRGQLLQVPGTCWFLRRHGVGVDVYKTPDVGGIDFDFDKPHPDEWRLRIFFRKQLNDGQLSYAEYQALAENEEALERAVKEALDGAA